ncbi:MAG: hypothetical protein ABJG15_14630 [Hyphomonadaceae bacterium]
MRDESVPQPFLVAFPMEDEDPRIMLDPMYFTGLDEVGLFLVDLSRLYARAFVQSGRARNMRDALEQIQEIFDADISEPVPDEEGEGA